jgi:hypothetical protein
VSQLIATPPGATKGPGAREATLKETAEGLQGSPMQPPEVPIDSLDLYQSDDMVISKPQMATTQMMTDDDQTRRPDQMTASKRDNNTSASQNQSSQQSQSTDAESSVADEEERSAKKIKREARNKATKEDFIRMINL